VNVAKFVLALDQGTTSSRAILFDRAGRIVGSAQEELTQHYPRPGWVEHDPEEIWGSQRRVLAAALARAGARAGDLAALGITNQRETTLLWDRETGEALHHAIVWQDRRTAPLCDALKARGLEGLFRDRTGLVLDPYFSATKLRWLLDNVAGARARAEAGRLAFGTVDSWLAWKLTGGGAHLTDASNASRTLLYNLATGDWDDELLEILAIPRALMPEIHPSSEVYAETLPDLLGGAVKVAGIAGDQQAASFGQSLFTVGQAKNTYGTGCFILMNTGGAPKLSEHGLLSTVAWRLGAGETYRNETPRNETYALEGSIFVAGAVVQWLRDGLGLIKTSAEVEDLARSVASSGGVYLVPAFVGLGAPHWDPYARGAVVGLTRGSGRGELARAALESIAFQTHDVVRAMEKDAGTPLAELRVDGGASSNDLLMQFQADVLGVPVIRPKVTETTALGAAFLAGLAVGFWQDQGEIAATWAEERRFEPAMKDSQRDALLDGWERALERSKGWERES
jgi:glycerol kinase